ncbi:sensor histidine kinase [Mucilaginibacter sp.]|jgi:PAS domain S-box-containing protein|uniref:sensor histidine kinase n=1 Tax=Mucilaginibacter sp. TaxID=1882438 RepID=UPI002B5D4F4C|nr:ATP-binding protein [Mucilaginibacter sp.]HTI60082.1 ATP-binding protein [Mucilaginibacter sp.]
MQKKTAFFAPENNRVKVDKWENIPLWCAGTVVSIAILALIGWCFDISAFKAFMSDGINMTVNTAHLLILGGLSLALLHSGQVKAARVLLTVSLLFALVIIYEHISGINLHIDRFPDAVYPGKQKIENSGRTPLLMALYTVLSSTALLLSSAKRYYTAQFISTTLVVLIYISLLGILFHFFGFNFSSGVAGPAFHTAASLLLLAVGTILLEPDEGWIKLLYRRIARKNLLIYLLGYILAAAPLFAAMYLFVMKNSTIAPASDMLVLFLLTIILSVPVVYFLIQLFNRLDEEVRGAHEQLRIAVHASGSGVWDIDLHMGTLNYSDQFAHLLGATDKPLLNAKALWYRLHRDDVDMALAAFEKAVRSGRLDFKARILAENGRVRWLQFYGETQRDKNGTPVRLLGTVMDITAQKELEQQKDEFISIASHELKTPLTSLKSYVQLAHIKARPLEDQTVSGMLEKAETQVNKMTRMIGDFLNAAQSEAGKMVLNKEEFLLDELIREVIADLSVNNRKQPISLNDALPVKINADREKIAQVLANLIGNAVKYSIGEKPVTLHCRREHGRVLVRIDDHGIGISDEDKVHLFDRFYRSGNPNTRTVSGFGIGLYVSAEIVKLHGGTIGVDSEIGKGSSFWFDLPATTTVSNPVEQLTVK